MFLLLPAVWLSELDFCSRRMFWLAQLQCIALFPLHFKWVFPSVGVVPYSGMFPGRVEALQNASPALPCAANAQVRRSQLITTTAATAAPPPEVKFAAVRVRVQQQPAERIRAWIQTGRVVSNLYMVPTKYCTRSPSLIFTNSMWQKNYI